MDMGGYRYRGVVRGVEGCKTHGGARQTHVGSQGRTTVMIVGGADDDGGDVSGRVVFELVYCGIVYLYCSRCSITVTLGLCI